MTSQNPASDPPSPASVPPGLLSHLLPRYDKAAAASLVSDFRDGFFLRVRRLTARRYPLQPPGP